MQPEEGAGFNLDDQDRLPWLEPAEPFEDHERVPVQKVAALVLLGLALLGLIVGGGWWLKSRGEQAGTGEVTLIPSPGGPYKIPAPNPKAKEFQGEGDEAYSASEGGEANGRIDASKAPEVPITDRVTAAPPLPPAPAAKAQAKGESNGGAKAPAPAAAPARLATESASASGLVQLGAYASEPIAQEAWKRLVKRFEELSSASHSVEPVKAANGSTLYRLRMSAGGTVEATALCGKLRVAGEVCWVVP